jgi:hypothetical protein
MTPTRFPLQWPVGWKRTPSSLRIPGHFGTAKQAAGASWRCKDLITMAQACDRLLAELQRMGVPDWQVVVSTNVATRLDGRPRSDQRMPDDPGAAVYWRDEAAAGGPQDRCMAIDKYTRVEQNVAALAATIEAMRAIERHGGATVLNRAFTGFTALPPPIVAGTKRPWWEVLDCSPNTRSREVVDHSFRRLAAKFHPDKGGDQARMAEINAARDEALKEIG